METTSLVALGREDNIHFCGDELVAVMDVDNHLYAPLNEMRPGEKRTVSRNHRSALLEQLCFLLQNTGGNISTGTYIKRLRYGLIRGTCTRTGAARAR